jgi:two-component system, NtrC family, C4-dicarboxylate transport response regulator DctD
MDALLLGTSEAMREVRRQLERLAELPTTVLLLGETGTGKGVAARALHAAGARRTRPFVHLDCAGLPEALFESELLGHERGAFTGAVATRIGRAEAAANGTLFLDEIGELSLQLQAKLLRLLQDRCFERVGGGAPRPFRARVVAATNVDVDAAAARGAFRRDLLFRLDVARVTLPPLRERREDLPALARVLLARTAERLGLAPPACDASFLAGHAAHDWPGNVRELENAAERWLIGGGAAPAPRTEAERIARTLDATGGNVARAARRLGLARSTLRGHIARLDLSAHLPRD